MIIAAFSLTKFITPVPGATGDKGDKGTDGSSGTKGDKGDAGSAGDKGSTGSTGDKGEKGDKPVRGVDYFIMNGMRGPQGPPGRDGLESTGGGDSLLENSTYTYVDSLVTRIDYASGQYKTFTYNLIIKLFESRIYLIK